MGNSESDIIGTVDDPLIEARQLAEGASKAGVPLRLLGGLAVRVLCPDFPPRLRAGQDIDLACLGKNRQQGGRTWRARAASRTGGSTT